MGTLTSGTPAQVVGTLLKRTRDASLAATFVRPRVRTSASVSIGTGVERRDFDTEPAQYVAQLDTIYRRAYTFPRVFVGATFAVEADGANKVGSAVVG